MSHSKQSQSQWTYQTVRWVAILNVFFLTIEPATNSPVLAQITPDNTLGVEQSLLQGTVIRGGAQRQGNLFHSFSEFNVGDRQAIYFANPIGVDRILARMTGNSRSNILGVLGVQGNADLFLLNPNGIVFGRNAQLDVRGSFVATTATGVQFGTQGVFRADIPNAPPLLTIQPSALWFNQPQPAAIVNQSVAFAGRSPGGFNVFGLRVPDGRNLLLVGGAVQLNQGGVLALGGRIELGGLATSGVVELTPDYQLKFPTGVERADVSLTSAIVDVAAGGRGDVVITANNINIQQSAIYAGIVTPGGTIARQAGAITLNATNAITIVGQGSTLENSTSPNAFGNGGDIQMRARSVAVLNGASVLTLNGRQGKAGKIDIATTDSITIAGFGSQSSSAILSQVSRGSGMGGDVILTTRQLSILNSATVGTAAFAQGDAGNVYIVAENITIDGVGNTRSSAITSSVAPRAVGKGGLINIQTGTLSITNGGRLLASTFGQGDAGNIQVTARDRVMLDGSGSNQFPSAIVSQVATPGVGNGGTIQVTAPTITLTNGAQLAASTFGRGSAGDIILQARDTILFDGVNNQNKASGAFSSVEANAIGRGGNISISSETVRLTNNAGLFASTIGQGDAGKIQIQTGTIALATGGRILSTVEPTGNGNGQEISIQTRSLTLTDNAQINASTAGNGRAGQIQITTDVFSADTGGQLLTTTSSSRDAGDIRLQVRDRLTLAGSMTGLFANTEPGSNGQGGSIFVSANRLDIFDRASITVGSQGTGAGGNIDIRAGQMTLTNQATLSAETVSTQGGNITIQNTDRLLLRNNSLISTSAGTLQSGGNGGNITIRAPFIVSVLAENNDIRANAFTGNGGNIDITAQGIFGIQFQTVNTPNSDITASSEFGLSGVVFLNTLNLDPTQGAVTLPTLFSPPPLTQGCRTPDRQTSRFISTGRGGVPTNPSAPIAPEPLWQDLEPLEGDKQIRSTHPASSNVSTPPPNWQVSPEGAIALTCKNF